jgi:hypothetical protein
MAFAKRSTSPSSNYKIEEQGLVEMILEGSREKEKMQFWNEAETKVDIV